MERSKIRSSQINRPIGSLQLPQMKRQNRKRIVEAKSRAKAPREDAAPAETSNEAGNPFAVFTEWSGAADERAYADL